MTIPLGLPQIHNSVGSESNHRCPDGFYGHWIVDCMKRGSKLIVDDPRATWLSSRAEYFLQCRRERRGHSPGMINLIIQNEWYDKEIVEKWCYGFDKLKERAAEYSRAWNS